MHISVPMYREKRGAGWAIGTDRIYGGLCDRFYNKLAVGCVMRVISLRSGDENRIIEFGKCICI